MRVRLLLNIGIKDAPRLGLDAPKALAGEVVTVDDKAGEEMLRRGWATDRLDAPKAARDARLSDAENDRLEAAAEAGRAADKAAAESAKAPAAGAAPAPTTSANAPANNPAPSPAAPPPPPPPPPPPGQPGNNPKGPR